MDEVSDDGDSPGLWRDYDMVIYRCTRDSIGSCLGLGRLLDFVGFMDSKRRG